MCCPGQSRWLPRLAICCLQGDWGTQFGMLIQNMQDQGGLDHVGNNSISDLLILYRCARCSLLGGNLKRASRVKRCVSAACAPKCDTWHGIQYSRFGS